MTTTADAHGSTADHTALVAAVLKHYGREPDLTIWRNSRVTMRRGQPHANPGLCTGASDIVGILEVSPPFGVSWECRDARGEIWASSMPTLGRFCAFEAKTGNSRPTKLQRMFLELVRRRGGFACVFRSVEEFGEALERARRGESE